MEANNLLVELEILKNELIVTDDLDILYIKIFNFYKISKQDFNNEKIVNTTNEIRKLFLQKQKYEYAKSIYNFILEHRNNTLLLERKIINVDDNDDAEFLPHLDNYNLADTLFSQSKFNEATPIYETILQAIDNNFNPIHHRRIKIIYKLGLIYYYSRKYADSSIMLLFVHKHLNIIFNNNKFEINKYEAQLDKMFYKMGKIFVEENKVVHALEMFNLVFYYYNKQNNNNVKYKVEIMFELGYLYYRLGKFDESVTNYLKLNDIIKNSKIYGHDHTETMRSMYNLGIVFYEQEKYDDALIHILAVYKIRRNKLGNTNISTVKAMYKLGCIYHKLKQYDNGIDKLKNAFKYMDSKNNLDDNFTIDIKYYLANIYFEQKNYEKARHEYTFILNKWNAHLKSSNIYMLQIFDKIALTYYNQEKYELAKTSWFKGLDSLDKQFDDKIIIYDIYYHLGLTFYKLDELNDADRILKDVYFVWCDKFTPSHSKSILIKQILLQINTRRYAQYVKKNRKVINKITPNNIECDSKLVTLSIAYKMGLIYYYKNDFTLAEDIFVDLIKYQENNPEVNIIETINAIYNLGCIYYKMDNFGKAVELFNHLLTIQKSILNYAIENVIYVMQNLALLYYKLNKINDALTTCQQLLNYQKESLGISHQDTIFTIKLIEEIL
jgi:tetratricopeptide (TPR) repeat protein